MNPFTLLSLRRSQRRGARRPAAQPRARLWLEPVEERVCLSPVTLNAIDSGWYDNTGFHAPTNTNYVAGRINETTPPPPVNTTNRNFFVFNLPRNPITAARLRLFLPSTPVPGGYVSPDPTETYVVYDAQTPVTELRAGGTGRTAIYADLGEGPEFGTRVISNADEGQILEIPLNGDALGALNTARGAPFALGGALTTISGDATQVVFAFTGAGTRQLALEIVDGPRVISQTPTLGPGPISSVRVTFDRDINPATVGVDDVFFFVGPLGDIPVTSVTPVTGNPRAFDINFPPQTIASFYTFSIGPYIFDLAGNPMDQTSDGILAQSDDYYHGGFAIQGPRVLYGFPLLDPGSTQAVVRVVFTKSMDTTTISPDTVSLTGPAGPIEILSIAPVDGTNNTEFALRVNSPLTERVRYTLRVLAFARDVFGNPLDQNNNGLAGELPEDNFAGPVFPVGCVSGDAFGYFACSTGFTYDPLWPGEPGVFTIIASGDDTFNSVDLGSNTFNFYGSSFTGTNQLFVSSNGLITFGTGTTALTNTNLTTSPTQRTIAVLWDDWIKAAGPVPMVMGRLVGNTLTVQWTGMDHFSGPRGTGDVTFQAVLQLNTGANAGAIKINYLNLNAGSPAFNNGVSASVGIKDVGTQGPNRILISANALSPFVNSFGALEFARPSGGSGPGAPGGGSRDEGAVTQALPAALRDEFVTPATAVLPLTRQPDAASADQFFSALLQEQSEATSPKLTARAVSDAFQFDESLFELAW